MIPRDGDWSEQRSCKSLAVCAGVSHLTAPFASGGDGGTPFDPVTSGCRVYDSRYCHRGLNLYRWSDHLDQAILYVYIGNIIDHELIIKSRC